MASPAKTVLIVGAAGRTGRLAAAALAERGWRVRGLVRDVGATAAVLPTSVERVAGQVEDAAAMAAAVIGAHAVLFAASAGAAANADPRVVDYAGVAMAATAAASAGVHHFVLVSSAAVTQPEHPHNASVRNVLKWKRKGEEALRAQGLPHTIVRGLGLRDRPGGVAGLRMVQGDRIAFGEDISRADLAAFLVDVICAGAGDSASGFTGDFDQASLIGATLEVYNDLRLTGGQWRCAQTALVGGGQVA